MEEKNTKFDGSIPENYDRYLGPILFEPYAVDLAGRLDTEAAADVLELACGTGILTRQLRRRLSLSSRLVATDLNDPMLQYFYEVPFSLHDHAALKEMVFTAGFRDINLSIVSKVGEGPSSRDVAQGLVYGNPLITAIREQDIIDAETVVNEIDRAVASECGGAPARGRMQAIVITARR